MIQIGCCTFAFRWLKLEDALRLAKNLGFQYVDVSVSGTQHQISQGRAVANPRAEGERLQALATKYNLTLSECFMTHVFVDCQPVMPNDTDALARKSMLQVFERLCEFAHVAGFETIMGVSGKPDEQGEPNWQIAVETLSEMVRIARSHDLIFTVEPSIGSIISKPELALRLVEQIPDLRYTLDYSHYIGQGYTLEDVKPLNPFAAHMHAKPCALNIPKCLVDEADINFGEIINSLQAVGWSGVFATEYIGDNQTATMTAHPAFQNMLLARMLEHALNLQ